MSVVIGICGINFCSFVVDGRLVVGNNDQLTVISERVRKIYKINNHVLFSGTGWFLDDEEITSPLDSFENWEVITAEMARNAVIEYIENYQHLIRSPRNYLIGYKSDDGSFGIHEIHYDSDTRNIVAVERKPQLPTSSFAISCCLPPKVRNRGQECINKVTCCITSSRMHDELIQKVGTVIGEISQIDESVNSNILVESLY